jgi:hypothetical protein
VSFLILLETVARISSAELGPSVRGARFKELAMARDKSLMDGRSMLVLGEAAVMVASCIASLATARNNVQKAQWIFF